MKRRTDGRLYLQQQMVEHKAKADAQRLRSNLASVSIWVCFGLGAYGACIINAPTSFPFLGFICLIFTGYYCLCLRYLPIAYVLNRDW